ncbi:MAG TPA: cytochrome c maturation protein CcmE [Acidimicrobiales bacterium]|nr:cytochrome c maturation protein CcmE [Acidimicrobiales bacterium]
MPDIDTASDLTPVSAPPTKRRGRWRTIGVLVVLVGAVLALLSQGLLHSLNYFETINQAMNSRAKLGTQTFRLEGVVKAHTINRTANGASFWITGGGHQIFVNAHGSPPQLFQSNIPVVVEGHFTSDSSDTFYGTQIIVKHTASYIAAHPHRVKAPNGTVR